jgi:phosphotransferase system HPr-like phosphotransfer protein
LFSSVILYPFPLSRTKKDLEMFLKDGDINVDRFLLFIRDHHSLLFPAFQMQLALKKGILGVNFWESCAQRRVQLSKKKYVTIKQIIELQALELQKDRMKHVQVRTNSGKIALTSLGTAHNRRLKYSSSGDDEELDPTCLNSPTATHGQCKKNQLKLSILSTYLFLFFLFVFFSQP